jgi:DNA topoisomerase-3
MSRYEANSMPEMQSGKVKCACGLIAIVKTSSKAGENQGRSFYTCTKASSTRCRFFQWVDEQPLATGSTLSATCFSCGGQGHFASQCSQKQGAKGATATKRANSSRGKYKKRKGTEDLY